MQDRKKCVADIGELLKKDGMTLAAAESCTGGLISSTLTDVSGSSDWFTGAVVAYANEVKSGLLGVKHETLQEHGAVSEECVREMAAGAAELLRTQAAVAVSGIAGPSGGTPDKPVGTVCFGFHIAGQTSVETRHFLGSRSQVKYVTLDHCLATLLAMIQKRHEG